MTLPIQGLFTVLLCMLLASVMGCDEAGDISGVKVQTKNTVANEVSIDLVRQKINTAKTQRQTLEDRIAALKQQIDQVERVSYTAEAAAERWSKDAARIRQEVGQVDERQAQLVRLIDGGKPTMLGGQERSIDDLRQMAARGEDEILPELRSKIAHSEEMAALATQNSRLSRVEVQRHRAQLTKFQQTLDRVQENMNSLGQRADAVNDTGGARLSLNHDIEQFEQDLTKVADGIESERKQVSARLAQPTSSEYLSQTRVDRPIEQRIKERQNSAGSGPATAPASH